MATEKTHYEVLGVARSASPEEIRRAYRALARRLHPDALASEGSGTSTTSHTTSAVGRGVTMADVNRAWDVLSDAASRGQYDASLDAAVGAGRGYHGSRTEAAGSQVNHDAGTMPSTNEGYFFEGPRFPWRAMLILAVVGAIAVLTAHASNTPDVPFAPDQLLQPGSCVDFDQNNDAVEVLCTGPHDGVVRQLVPIDQSCPMDTEPHRDRQGMGIACVDPATATSG